MKKTLVALVAVVVGMGIGFSIPKDKKPSPVVLRDGDPPPCGMPGFPNCPK